VSCRSTGLLGAVPVNPRRYRAPVEDGSVLADPPLAQAGPILAANQSLLDNASIHIDGIPLPDFRRRAREEAVALARQYLTECGERPHSPDSTTGLLLSGHQPAIFHPGVWVKNFALNGLARRHGLVPLNLIADNDAAKSTSLRFPVPGDPDTVHLQSIPFDRFDGRAPYEDRRVQDESLFRTFVERTERIWRHWGFTPMLPEVWADVLHQYKRTPLLGECLAAARRAWERRWGCHNLELPLSRLCDSEAFACFIRHLLNDLPRFHAIYNESLREYRRSHGVRDRSRPVPDLAREGDRYEIPFWALRPGEQRRKRLALRPGESVPAGVRLRTRALMTTLFARVCLGDGFIHGIGGGKYDEVTDAIIERWLGLTPPRFFVLTATLRLPLPAFPTRRNDVRAAAQRVRDLVWNPQRHLAAEAMIDPAVRQLAVEKERHIREEPRGKAERRARYQSLRLLTEALRPWVGKQIEAAQADHDCRAAEWLANRKLLRRDFAWSLFPHDMLSAFCRRFLDPA
jgi:hypothetical protein